MIPMKKLMFTLTRFKGQDEDEEGRSTHTSTQETSSASSWPPMQTRDLSSKWSSETMRPSKSNLLRRRETVQASPCMKTIQVPNTNGDPTSQSPVERYQPIDSPMELDVTPDQARTRSRPSTRDSTSNNVRDKPRPSTRDSLDYQEAFALFPTVPLPPVQALPPVQSRPRARTESRKRRHEPAIAISPPMYGCSRPQTSEGVIPFPGLPPDAPLPPLPSSLRLATQRDMMREIERLLVATREFESKAAELQATVRYLQKRVESSPIIVS